LQNREDKRNKELKESLAKLAENKKTKDAKSAAKKGDKKGSGSSKSSNGKPKKKEVQVAAPPKVIKKYASASDFMDTHFPSFDDMIGNGNIGPMRAEQLDECDRVLHALADFNVSEETVRRALLVPQDRPEAICLEGTKTATEGLMVNPLPKEYWRSGVAAGKKKKKKGAGKKKK
jgi:hypothetical protein